MARARTLAAPPRTPGLPPWQHLVGFAAELAAWQELTQSRRLPPVLLLTGRAGLGKRALLAALTALQFCDHGNACGSCSSCQWVLAGEHPEVFWRDGRSSDGKLLIADAAALQEHLSLSPGHGAPVRVAVLADADQLSVQAANRLLKTLEEPPPRARIFLSTSRADAMLPTVLSRCVRWRLSPPPIAASIAWLTSAYTAAGQEVPALEVMTALLKQSGLAPGAAWQQAGLSSTPAPQLAAGVVAVLRSASLEVALQRAADLSRSSGLSLAELLTAWEMGLNEAYHGGMPAPDVALLTRRRAVLRRAKELVHGHRVALNAQLACESLAW